MFLTVSVLISTSLAAQPADSIPKQILLRDSLKEDVVVQFVKASEQTPVTQTNLGVKEIQRSYYGQDIPFLLQQTPGIIGRSDAGIGIGYTDFRMRGMDQTRINFNINGIPVNDPENQGFFTNNFADLAASAKSIQVQRGVGTTANGSAPYAGSVHVITKDAFAPAGFAASANYGSFNTHRLSAEFNTGLSRNGFGAYGRVSSIGTSGYRQGAWADLKTYLISVGAMGRKYTLKFNMFGGITRTGLSYLPIPTDSLRTNRTYNPLTRNETDEFQQHFFQLQYSYNLSNKLTFSSSAYYVKGVAPRFAVLFPGTSYLYANMPNAISVNGRDTSSTADFMMNYQLNQDLFGGMAFLNYTTDKLSLSGGVHANYFKADHFMTVLHASQFPTGITSGHQVYLNTGYKSELSSFIKCNYLADNRFYLFFDMQLRIPTMWYTANANINPYDTFSVERMQWYFFNPRVGGRYLVNKSVSLYGTVGMVSREPTRFDYMQDDRANAPIRQNDLKPESVLDWESGIEYKTERTRLAANAYWMEFTNEIASTGEINNFGYLRRVNVASSFRSGIELFYQTQLTEWLSLYGAGALSYNKIRSYTQNFRVDSAGSTLTKKVEFRDVDPLLTPNATFNQSVQVKPFNWLSFDLTGRYVSKSYLDNTQNEQMTVPEYAFLDFKTELDLSPFVKGIAPTLVFQVNNLTNSLYSPMGVSGTPWQPGITYVRDGAGQDSPRYNPLYFPAATRNVFAGLRIKF